MKYEKCITCPELGKSCDGPNFLSMEPKELGQWCCERRKTIPGMTVDKLADVAAISKSAVSNFLNGKHEDYRMDTIRPIIKLLTGGKWDDNACGNVSSSEKALYETEIRKLRERTEHLQKDIEDRDEQIRFKNRVITGLVFGVIVAMLFMVTAFIFALS